MAWEVGWPQIQSGRFRKETNLLLLLGIEPRSFNFPARSLVAILTELSRLLCIRNRRQVLKENRNQILRSCDAIQTLSFVVLETHVSPNFRPAETKICLEGADKTNGWVQY